LSRASNYPAKPGEVGDFSEALKNVENVEESWNFADC